ncbi:NADase-type glycan-binding domain-containing protein [Intestinibacter sp.]
MICKYCNHNNDDNSKFCRYCGNSLNIDYESGVDFYEDNSDYSNIRQQDKSNKSQNKIVQKIIMVISCIVLILAGVFIILRFDILGNNKDDSISSSQNTINSTQNNQDSGIEQSSSTNKNLGINQNTNSGNGNPNNTSKSVIKLNISNSDCSSILHDSSNKNYGSAKTIDGDFATVWSEGVSGYGQGEWLRLDLDSTYTIKKVKIVNGLVNKKNGYYNNNRAKSLTLTFSDGSSQNIYLEDDNTGYQVIDINPVKSNFIKFTINSVYYGSKYDDTCIADIEILGY